MTISAINPSFCGLKQTIKTQRNMHKVANMIGQTGVYTESKKDGNKGGFIVSGMVVLLNVGKFTMVPALHLLKTITVDFITVKQSPFLFRSHLPIYQPSPWMVVV